MSTAKIVLISLVSYLVIGGILFGVAGRWDLPWFWLTLATFAATHLITALVINHHDPELVRERMKPGPGVPGWDRAIMTLSGVLALVNFVVVPLDVGRFHWSDTVPDWLQAIGLVGIVLGMSLLLWSMLANTYFSKLVRIQDERKHRVIDSGPYRFVRHPGYVGWMLLWLSLNLALGSWLGVGFSALTTLVVIIRTVLEDRFLQQHLPGYSDYAGRVRWRLLPGLW